MKALTHEQFERVLVRITIAERGVMLSVASHESEAKQNLAVNHSFELRDQALAAYDAQGARIAQLEREVHLVRERNAELAAQRLEADDRAYYEGRIAELESQRDALLAACWAVALAITAQQQYDAYQLCVDAIAKAQGEVCSFCGGTGAVDSGAPSPQGYFIDVPCPECDGTGDPRQRKEVPNGV